MIRSKFTNSHSTLSAAAPETDPTKPTGHPAEEAAAEPAPLLGWRARPRAEGPRRLRRLSSAARESLRLEGLDLASRSGPFEWADIAWDLCDAGRPEAAAAFWSAVLELYDCDARVHLYYSDSLSEAGQPEEALRAAIRGYRLEPELFEFQEAVLDLLFALGRSEIDFAWESPAPTVVRIGTETSRRIAAHLEEDGECDLFDLRYTLFDDEYLCFDVEDLARSLEQDGLFEVCRFEGAAYASLRQTPDGD